MILFLATFFMALFTDEMEDSIFQTVLDRLASSADFSSVKDGITVFLRIHFDAIPTGLDLSVSIRIYLFTVSLFTLLI
jgi:hypothetical protein